MSYIKRKIYEKPRLLSDVLLKFIYPIIGDNIYNNMIMMILTIYNCIVNFVANVW